jgi:hypothetical protein
MQNFQGTRKIQVPKSNGCSSTNNQIVSRIKIIGELQFDA